MTSANPSTTSPSLCTLTPSLGNLGSALRVCLTFGFFAKLRHSNLAQPSAAQFDPSRHTCRGDIFFAPPGLHILVRWTKTHQSVGRAPVLLIPDVPGHPADPVAAYHLLFIASPTTSPDQLLLSYLQQGHRTMVTVPILSQALASLLHDLGYDAGLFSLHSLCRGGATAAYRQGLDQINIKCQGLWTSDAFWQYITSSCTATSPLIEGLACTVHSTPTPSTSSCS